MNRNGSRHALAHPDDSFRPSAPPRRRCRSISSTTPLTARAHSYRIPWICPLLPYSQLSKTAANCRHCASRAWRRARIVARKSTTSSTGEADDGEGGWKSFSFELQWFSWTTEPSRHHFHWVRGYPTKFANRTALRCAHQIVY